MSEPIVSELYGETHRSFQDGRGTRKLADRLESLVRAEFDTNDRAFIESATMFFLATVDEKGRPTVSYKGGAPGFVRITAPGELVFPVYDGNGMFLSLGNIVSSAHVGMLFIDFESPRRLRVQGMARVQTGNNLLGEFPGAQYLVQVAVEQIFVNCGRYIHKLESRTLSRHVPDESGRQPFPAWKRIDVLAETLPEDDKGRVARAGGPIPVDAYHGEEAPDTNSTVA
ncbi:MAG: pyridoxamine 5'-phosphate oxidase family protein [Steroidobacteraceae bacterium]